MGDVVRLLHAAAADPEPAYGVTFTRSGPWVRRFAWLPVVTSDGVCWLKPYRARRVKVFEYCGAAEGMGVTRDLAGHLLSHRLHSSHTERESLP